MKKILILACSCFLIAACNQNAKTNKASEADSILRLLVHKPKQMLLILKVHTKAFCQQLIARESRLQ